MLNLLLSDNVDNICKVFIVSAKNRLDSDVFYTIHYKKKTLLNQ